MSIRFNQAGKLKPLFIKTFFTPIFIFFSACGGGGSDGNNNDVLNEEQSLFNFESFEAIRTFAELNGAEVSCTLCTSASLTSNNWTQWSVLGDPIRAGDYLMYWQPGGALTPAYPTSSGQIRLSNNTGNNRLSITTIDLINGAESEGSSNVYFAPSSQFVKYETPSLNNPNRWYIEILTEEIIEQDNTPIYRAIRHISGWMLDRGYAIQSGVWPEYCDPGSSIEGEVSLYIVERFDNQLAPPLGLAYNNAMYMTRVEEDANCQVVDADEF